MNLLFNIKNLIKILNLLIFKKEFLINTFKFINI